MSPKIILLIILFLVAKTVEGQQYWPASDSCGVIVRFMSLGKIPYPGRMIVCYLENMYFDFDNSSLQPDSFPELNNLVSVLKRFPEICIEIRGHTDSCGDDEYNRRLSERRSATVRNHLIESGISSRRIQSTGYGEEFPVQTNETESGRQANRRIEVKILSR